MRLEHANFHKNKLIKFCDVFLIYVFFFFFGKTTSLCLNKMSCRRSSTEIFKQDWPSIKKKPV